MRSKTSLTIKFPNRSLGTRAKYKFTGKERDNESYYDYFGARYYDSRIGRWGSVEPMYNKYLPWSPYNYSLLNPLIITDRSGEDPKREQLGSLSDIMSIIENSSSKDYAQLQKEFGSQKGRYLYTEKGGIIDMKHFFAAIEYATKFGYMATIFAGAGFEIKQGWTGEPSNFAPEDAYSNRLGAEYGAFEHPFTMELDVIVLKEYLENLNPVSPEDPRISRENIYVPEGENAPELPKRNLFDFIMAQPFYGMDPKNISKELEKLP